MKRLIPEPYLTYSRQQRKSQNPWEAKLWQFLRAGRFCGLKFKRQVQLGLYIYDFSCREKSLIIELDGGQHSREETQQKDRYKQSFAEGQGYKILRFQNIDVDKNIDGVLESIKRECGV